MITSTVWWQIIVGGVFLGFGFACGEALFRGIVSLLKR